MLPPTCQIMSYNSVLPQFLYSIWVFFQNNFSHFSNWISRNFCFSWKSPSHRIQLHSIFGILQKDCYVKWKSRFDILKTKKNFFQYGNHEQLSKLKINTKKQLIWKEKLKFELKSEFSQIVSVSKVENTCKWKVKMSNFS